LRDGINGERGPEGPQGTIPDNVCVFEKVKADGTLIISCAGYEADLSDTELQLEGCKTAYDQDNKFQVTLTCSGKDLYLCGGQAYDPVKYHCEEWSAATNADAGNYYFQDANSNYYIPYNNSIGVVRLSLCGGSDPDVHSYDSRTEFCDFSVSGGVKKPYCGTNKEKYRTGAPWGEQCGTTATSDPATSRVTRLCGTNRYVKATEFCMYTKSNSKYSITARCGVADPTSGQYNTGKYTESRIQTGTILTYAGDASFGFYAQGDANNMPVATNEITINVGGVLYKGEYNSDDEEYCLDGKVVKICGKNADGSNQYYDESWQFCAFGNKVAPHCSDRVIYDPEKKFCSFVGNSQINIPEYIGTGGWLDPTYDCISDPTNAKCYSTRSTALTYCGTGTGANNRYNDGSWRWEYCTEPTVGSFSILRCAEKQEPIDRSLIDASHPPVDINERSRCQCIAGAKPFAMGQNGCECAPGFSVYDADSATGLTKTNIAGTTDSVARLSGGICVLTTSGSTLPSSCANNRDPKRVKHDGECCSSTELAFYNSATAPTATTCTAINNAPCTADKILSSNQATATCIDRVKGGSSGASNGEYCITKVRQYNGVEYCTQTGTAPLTCTSPLVAITDNDGTQKCSATGSPSISDCTVSSANGGTFSSNACGCVAGYSLGGAVCRIASAVTGAWCNYGKVKAPGLLANSSGCLDDEAACGTAGGTATDGACSCGAKTWFGTNSVSAGVNKCLDCDADQVFIAEGNSECVWKDAASASGSSTVLKVCTGDASTGKFCDTGASACTQTVTGTCD